VGENVVDWDDYTPSQHWDALCEFASVKGIQAKALIEEADGTLTLVMRTADPKLNPGAVAVSESSTPFRRMLAEATRGLILT
jgi:hypothetical protein